MAIAALENAAHNARAGGRAGREGDKSQAQISPPYVCQNLNTIVPLKLSSPASSLQFINNLHPKDDSLCPQISAQ